MGVWQAPYYLRGQGLEHFDLVFGKNDPATGNAVYVYRVNGQSQGELGVNAGVAAYHVVPIVLVLQSHFNGVE